MGCPISPTWDTRSDLSTLAAYPRHQVHFVPIATAVIALAVGRASVYPNY